MAHITNVLANSAGPYALLASAARTADTTSGVTQTFPAKGVHVIINVTVWTAGSITPHIQGYDVVSNSYYDILVGAAIGATGQTILKVGPGITPTANVAVADLLPANWRVLLHPSTVDPITYSVGMEIVS